MHAAFAGYTGVTVGLVNTHYCYLPINVIIQAPRKVRRRAFGNGECLVRGRGLYFGLQPGGARSLLPYLWRFDTRASRRRRLSQVDPEGELWGRLRASIGQPNFYA